MIAKKGDDQILQMMSLAEEISSINNKIGQLVEDLHNTQDVLLNLKDLTVKLKNKVGDIDGVVGKYEAPEVQETPNGVKPSYMETNTEPHRVVPTPENWAEVQPTPVPVRETTITNEPPKQPEIRKVDNPLKKTKKVSPPPDKRVERPKATTTKKPTKKSVSRIQKKKTPYGKFVKNG